jgi:glycosyltransferase involved in cell wall biosynthesis
LQVCTIIAKNYVAHARVLARSLAATHPGNRLWTLVIDDFEGYLDPAHEPFATLTPDDIGCEPFIQMALRYSVLELSTAVKPWLLRHLMAATGEPVTYLDPDIKIFGSLTRLDELAADHGLALIPHNSAPIPPDGRSPSQVDVMIAGIYNLGFVSVSRRPEVERLLSWWAERLERDCRVDPVWGYFVDQRWFDLAPGFVSDLAIVRDPEYNVAYWNLHDRRLAYAGAGYSVNDRPLAFFHFSGFDPANPLILSRHQDRIDVAADPVLRRLLGEYASEVLDEGHADSRHWPYGYGALGSGTRLDATLRTLYDDFAQVHGPDVPSPFTLRGARIFEGWVKEQAPGAPAGVSRALLHVCQRRDDLRGAFTGPWGIDAAGLLQWVRQYGENEEPLIFHLLSNSNGPSYVNGTPSPEPEAGESVPASPSSEVCAGLLAARDRRPPSALRTTDGSLRREPFGVNVVGYFRSELGTGEAARQMVSALDAQRIPLLPIHGQTIPVSRQSHPYETASPDEAPFPINLICMNADMLPEFARQVGTEFFAGRYSIGMWFWEVEPFPERWRDSFSLLEELWAPTAHIAAALRPQATIPVTTIRMPVAPAPVPPRSRAELGLDESRFLFLFSFDYLSVAERKNALGVIAAFRSAFGEGEGAQLVIKCINSEHNPDYHARLRAAVAAHSDVRLIDGYMSPSDNRSLSAVCDCYVSLHRAEGFGLGMAEAMWNGKPVIATGYSGNLDFMTVDNSLLVEHELVPIGEGFDPYPADGVWAQPSVEHAAALIRRVFDESEWSNQLGAIAADSIRRTHSPAAAGAILSERLDLIRATGRPRSGGASIYARTPALAALPLKVRQDPSEAKGRTRHAAREYARKLALRVMRPYIVHQRSVNGQIADAMRELAEGLSDVRRDTAAELARILAELRSARNAGVLEARVEEQALRIDELERRLADTEDLGGAPGADPRRA